MPAKSLLMGSSGLGDCLQSAPGGIVAAPRLAPWIGVVAALCLCATTGYGDEDRAVTRFQDDIQPLLIDYCYRCHAEGTSKGGVAFDAGGSDEAMVKRRDLWWSVLKNVRAGIMPPAGKPRPTAKEIEDPGRLDQARRLRRRPERSRPGPGDDPPAQPGRVPQHDPRPDGDRLPGGRGIPARRHGLRLRQHRRRAQRLAAAPGEILPGGRDASSKTAVPTASKLTPERSYRGVEFRGSEKGQNGDRLTFYKAATVSRSFDAEPPATIG